MVCLLFYQGFCLNVYGLFVVWNISLRIVVRFRCDFVKFIVYLTPSNYV